MSVSSPTNFASIELFSFEGNWFTVFLSSPAFGALTLYAWVDGSAADFATHPEGTLRAHVFKRYRPMVTKPERVMAVGMGSMTPAFVSASTMLVFSL